MVCRFWDIAHDGLAKSSIVSVRTSVRGRRARTFCDFGASTHRPDGVRGYSVGVGDVDQVLWRCGDWRDTTDHTNGRRSRGEHVAGLVVGRGQPDCNATE